jgi:DNA polymerase (family 10)
MTLALDGLRRGRRIIAAGSEAEIYEALGLQYIEPELREGLDEILCAAAHNIPPLVAGADLLGVLHAHTTASDGADTLDAMAEASLALRLPVHWRHRSLEDGALRRLASPSRKLAAAG